MLAVHKCKSKLGDRNYSHRYGKAWGNNLRYLRADGPHSSANVQITSCGQGGQATLHAKCTAPSIIRAMPFGSRCERQGQTKGQTAERSKPGRDGVGLLASASATSKGKQTQGSSLTAGGACLLNYYRTYTYYQIERLDGPEPSPSGESGGRRTVGAPPAPLSDSGSVH